MLQGHNVHFTELHNLLGLHIQWNDYFSPQYSLNVMKWLIYLMYLSLYCRHIHVNVH